MLNSDSWKSDSDPLDSSRQVGVPPPQSIIIKIWLETRDLDASTTWRGRLSHVPSGDVVYVRNLHEIVIFILQVLEGMGARLPFHWRLYRRLRNRFVSRTLCLSGSDTTLYTNERR